MSNLHREIAQFIESVRDPPKSAARQNTQSPSEHRKHNHFPMGKTGYDPKLARLMKQRGRRNK